MVAAPSDHEDAEERLTPELPPPPPPRVVDPASPCGAPPDAGHSGAGRVEAPTLPGHCPACHTHSLECHELQEPPPIPAYRDAKPAFREAEVCSDAALPNPGYRSEADRSSSFSSSEESLTSVPWQHTPSRSAGGFNALLRSLADMHEREVAELRADRDRLTQENAALSVQLGVEPRRSSARREAAGPSSALSKPSYSTSEGRLSPRSEEAEFPRRLSALDRLQQLQISMSNTAPRSESARSVHHPVAAEPEARANRRISFDEDCEEQPIHPPPVLGVSPRIDEEQPIQPREARANRRISFEEGCQEQPIHPPQVLGVSPRIDEEQPIQPLEARANRRISFEEGCQEQPIHPPPVRLNRCKSFEEGSVISVKSGRSARSGRSCRSKRVSIVSAGSERSCRIVGDHAFMSEGPSRRPSAVSTASPERVAGQMSQRCTRVRTVRDKVLSGPGDFELLSHWRKEATKLLDRRISFSCKFGHNALKRESEYYKPQTYAGNSIVAPYIILPNSVKRMVWDLVSMTFLAYDIIVIPFKGAFDPPPSKLGVFMTWLTLIFWSLDMPLCMITGYNDGKQTIVSLRLILLRYASTWLVLDILILGLDWALVLLDPEDDAGSAARLGRTLRTLRFIRTLRLIRVLKLKRVVQMIQDQINTETVSICFGIMKIILSLVIANHIVACAWFSIGSFGEENGTSWLTVYGMERGTLTYRYFTSLHWSLTQFTPASMEVFPVTVSERIYSVVILLFAMIAFSSFVSMLSASMAELKKISSDESRQFWLLRRYLRDWRVSRDVSMRIQRYLDYAYQRQRQKVQEKDVGLLALLSEPLKEDLKYETISHHISSHPLFSRCDEQTRIFVRALEATSLAAGDLIFSCGDRADRAVFLCNGTMEYTLGEMGDAVQNALDGGHQDRIEEGMWVCEAVLWTLWLHLGDLQALTESHIITIDAKIFGEQVQINRPLWMAVQGYAQAFVRALNKIKREDLTDLSQQLFSPMDAIEDSKFDQVVSSHRATAGKAVDDSTAFALLRQAAARSLNTIVGGLSSRRNSDASTSGVVPA